MRRRARSKRVREVDAVPAHRPRAVFALAQPTRVAGFKLAPERVARVDPRALALPARLPARAAAHRTPRLGRGIGATRRVAARVVGGCEKCRDGVRARGARRARGRRRRGRRARGGGGPRGGRGGARGGGAPRGGTTTTRTARTMAMGASTARASTGRRRAWCGARECGASWERLRRGDDDNGTKLECDERRRAISCS